MGCPSRIGLAGASILTENSGFLYSSIRKRGAYSRKSGSAESCSFSLAPYWPSGASAGMSSSSSKLPVESVVTVFGGKMLSSPVGEAMVSVSFFPAQSFPISQLIYKDNYHLNHEGRQIPDKKDFATAQFPMK